MSWPHRVGTMGRVQSLKAACSKQVEPSVVAPEGLHKLTLEYVKVVVVGEIQVVETCVGLAR